MIFSLHRDLVQHHKTRQQNLNYSHFYQQINFHDILYFSAKTCNFQFLSIPETIKLHSLTLFPPNKSQSELHSHHFINLINRQIVKNNIVIIKIEKETHIQRQRQQWAFATDIVIAEFHGVADMIMLPVAQNC